MQGTIEDPKGVQLPIEIWMVIIEFALDEYRRPYLYCTAKTFPQFQVHLAWCNRFDNLGRAEILGDWKNIRAVSRPWNHLARGPPYLILSDASDHIIKRTSSIFIKEKVEFSSCLQRVLDDPSLTLNVTALAFDGRTPENMLNLLFDNTLFFPGLKYLAIRAKIHGKVFWPHIGRAFPHLVALSIRTTVNDAIPEAPVVLKRLEILSLEGALPPVLVLPSLKHIYISKCQYLSHPFWRHHGHHIESLLVTGAASKWQAQIWEIFPNVEIFGDRSYCGIPSPPDHHPLRHLRIFAKLGGYYDRTIATIANFPRITHVHITRNCMRKADMTNLLEFCQQKGLNIVSVNPLRWNSSSLSNNLTNQDPGSS
ncbi:hypothetical protein FRC15_011447 [Serendipita sp. 397]|nr:hypothetical protein FRC15_011447 [Serendipita sp. 397]